MFKDHTKTNKVDIVDMLNDDEDDVEDEESDDEYEKYDVVLKEIGEESGLGRSNKYW